MSKKKEASLDLLKRMYQQGMMSKNAGSIAPPQVRLNVKQSRLGTPDPSQNPLKPRYSAFRKLFK